MVNNPEEGRDQLVDSGSQGREHDPSTESHFQAYRGNLVS